MRVLIIHTAFIGDIVLSTPLIKKVKDLYPEAEITYVTTPAGASILKNNPNLSEIIAYDKRGNHKGILGVWELGKRLRYKNFDLVICPHRYFRSSLLAWLSRAPVRIGYKIASGAFLFNKKIDYEKDKHEVEKLLSFIPDNPEKKDSDYDIELYPGKEEVEKIDILLKGYTDKKIIAIAPGSRWFTKKWPLEYFNEVIKKLAERDDILQVIIGGNEEKLLNVDLRENCLDLRGKTTLLELSELLKRSKVVLTNDSSPIHIASAFEKTYILGVFGPTVKEFGFFPWSKNSDVLEVMGLKCRPCAIHGGNNCPEKHFSCMLDIKPEMVCEKIIKKIG